MHLTVTSTIFQATNEICAEEGSSFGCHFLVGLCEFSPDENDDIDWLWHEGAGSDDPFLPEESESHDGYIYIDSSIASVSIVNLTIFCIFIC